MLFLVFFGFLLKDIEVLALEKKKQIRVMAGILDEMRGCPIYFRDRTTQGPF
jgi:hypothetical protein